MGITKHHVFTDYQNKIAKYSKAFAHPARVAIIEYLIKHKTCFMGKLSDELPLSQSTISQHLRELKDIGIIKGEIEGPSICYCINEEVWKEINVVLMQFLESIDTNCC